jgi:hypothetical protein
MKGMQPPMVGMASIFGPIQNKLHLNLLNGIHFTPLNYKLIFN